MASYAHNSDVYLIGFLACARAGLVHVPVNQNLTGEDLEYILSQSGSSLVLTDPDLAGRVPDGYAVRALRDAPDSCSRNWPRRGLSRRTANRARTTWSSCCTPRGPPHSPRAR